MVVMCRMAKDKRSMLSIYKLVMMRTEGIKYGRGTVDTLDRYRATEKIKK